MKMRRIFSALLAVAMLLAMPAAAAGDIGVLLNGAYVEFDVPPQIIDGRTMVPMRAIFEALGAGIDWDGDTLTVTAKRGGALVVMQIGNPAMSVNGEYIELDVAPQLVGGRTLVPVRAVAESFDARVDWDGDTRTVIIETDGGELFVVTPHGTRYHLPDCRHAQNVYELLTREEAEARGFEPCRVCEP